MWSVVYPALDAGETFQRCIKGCGGNEIQNSLMTFEDQVNAAAMNYVERAMDNRLYEIKNEIDCSIDKMRLNSVYEYGMRNKHSPGRAIYDKLMSLPDDDRCPFCDHWDVSSLDHILPKSKYPIFSVVPANLVAICTNCNQRKGDTSPTSQDDGVLHPYFDDIDGCQWLHACVIEGDTASVEFYVKQIEDWSHALNARIVNQFQMLELNELYSAQAAREMSIIQTNLQEHFENGGASFVKKELHIQWRSCESVRLNSWRTACYMALKESDWYCSIGYKFA